MEYTSPETPEQNGQVELNFATLWGKVTQDLREKLWAECASTETKLNNIISRKDGKTPFEKFFGYKSKMIQCLKVFGEVGVKLSELYVCPKNCQIKETYA
jgi:hypothetical protein